MDTNAVKLKFAFIRVH